MSLDRELEWFICRILLVLVLRVRNKLMPTIRRYDLGEKGGQSQFREDFPCQLLSDRQNGTLLLSTSFITVLATASRESGFENM